MQRFDMNKRLLISILLLVMLVDAAGCSGTWRRKFVRVKKEEEKEAPVLVPQDYKKEFTNNQLYANHFAFWKSAESELISSIRDKKSHKRLDRYTSYTIVEMNKLYNLLVPEKQKDFEPLVNEIKDIIAKISQPGYLDSNRNSIVSELSKHYRAVARSFSYFHMKNYIIPDEQEPEKTAQPPIPEAQIPSSETQSQ
jgi:hypothetical protein